MPTPRLYRVPDKVLIAQLRRTMAELAEVDLVRAAFDLVSWDAVSFTATLQARFEAFERVFQDRHLAAVSVADARDALLAVIDQSAAMWIATLDARIKTQARLAKLRRTPFDLHLPRIRTRRVRPDTYVQQLRLIRPELERVRVQLSGSPSDPFIDQGAALADALDAADLRIEAARAAERALVADLETARAALLEALVELDGWVNVAVQAGAPLVPGQDRQVVRQWIATRPSAVADR